MIREMTPDDIEGAILLCRELHLKSDFGRYVPHWPTVAQTVIRAASSPSGKVLLAEHNGKLTGIMIAVVQEYWWAEAKFGPRVASDLLFYSRRKGDGDLMLKRIIAWAWTVPRVVRVELAISSGIKPTRAEKVYLRAGLSRMGAMFCSTNPKVFEKAKVREEVTA